MLIETTRDMNFNDRVILKGTKGSVITKESIFRYPIEDRGRMRVMKQVYKKNGRQGIFVTLSGHWRWLDKGAYK